MIPRPPSSSRTGPLLPYTPLFRSARLHGRYHVVAVDFRRKVETDADSPSYKVEIHKRGFEDVFRKHKIDAVLHIGRIYPHEHDRTRRYNANVLGSKKLFELCRKYGVGQVLVHSTYFVSGTSAFNTSIGRAPWREKVCQ